MKAKLKTKQVFLNYFRARARRIHWADLSYLGLSSCAAAIEGGNPAKRNRNMKTLASLTTITAALVTAAITPASAAFHYPALDSPTSTLTGLLPEAVPASSPQHKRPWDIEFLTRWSQASSGAPISFELAAGDLASGTIRHCQTVNGELRYIAGELSSPEPGRFFFQKQTRPGVAGDFVGIVEFPGSEKAWRIEPAEPGRLQELVEQPLENVLCNKLPRPPPGEPEPTHQDPPLNPGDLRDLPIPRCQNGIVALESSPGSIPVIYLDFEGGYTPTWGGVAYERPSVSDEQIRDVWRQVAEDYLPFNINVTTDLHVYQNAPEGSRQRVIITPTTTAWPHGSGAAYTGSFNWTGDTPCWVFVVCGKNCAECCSHESGHTLGLAHQGQSCNPYFAGFGTGETSWCPIMGAAYLRNVTQWACGEYLDACCLEDELHMISSNNNNVTYRTDDTGDTLATSRYLEFYPDESAWAEGVIERTGDTDAFRFTTHGGTAWLSASPVPLLANLALQVAIRDVNGALLLSTNPQTTLGACLNLNVPAGTYTFQVSGAGRNDPLTNGFSSYGSLGYYSVTGSVANARLPDRFAIPEHSPIGTPVGTIHGPSASGDPLVYTITSGNTGNTFIVDNAGGLKVADNSLLDYAALASRTRFPVQFELFVTIEDRLEPSLTETEHRVLVAITRLPPLPEVIEPALKGALGADGLFHLILTGCTNKSYQIEFSSDLLHWTWLSQCRGSESGAPVEVVDPQSPSGNLARFYRIR
jgi:hypothetical protein